MEGKYKTNSLKYKTCTKTRSNVQMIPGDPPSPFPSCHSKDFWHLHSSPHFPRVVCRCVLPLSRQTGFNWKHRANQLKSQSVTSLGSRFWQQFAGFNIQVRFEEIVGFQGTIYTIIQKPPLLFPALLSFRYNLRIISWDFQWSFLSSRPSES